MLHDKIDIARLMVHAHPVEKSHQRKRGQENKKLMPSDKADFSTEKEFVWSPAQAKFQEGAPSIR